MEKLEPAIKAFSAELSNIDKEVNSPSSERILQISVPISEKLLYMIFDNLLEWYTGKPADKPLQLTYSKSPVNS